LSSLDVLRPVAEIEFSGIVVQTDLLGSKLRVPLTDGSYVDVWSSRKLEGRFGFHWERQHLDGCVCRYDNFPDANWADVSTFPFHFHDCSQENVAATPFSQTIEQGFREFMAFVQHKIGV
jgi:hypothetical protein